MLTCWPNLFFLFVSSYFIIFFIHDLVEWGCGIRIDGVLTLSQPYTADSFLIIIIIIIIIIITAIFKPSEQPTLHAQPSRVPRRGSGWTRLYDLSVSELL